MTQGGSFLVRWPVIAIAGSLLAGSFWLTNDLELRMTDHLTADLPEDLTNEPLTAWAAKTTNLNHLLNVANRLTAAREFTMADRVFDRAQDLAPEMKDVYLLRAWAALQGETHSRTAIARWLDQAYRLDPLDPNLQELRTAIQNGQRNV
ncbi:hypothetical protein HY523_00215 [Candidatus Berkelbacteria bacterium]|nr:hypothetical protein [Candidatus Berkelbacteria bacterium]